LVTRAASATLNLFNPPDPPAIWNIAR